MEVPQPPITESDEEEPAEEEPAEEPEPVYTVGELYVSPQREEYEGGEMLLEIPRLELEAEVLDGVDDVTLARGLGLFDQAQLPGSLSDNANVSISGHRDVHNMEFYDLDTVTEGDLLYLTYRGARYTYRYQETAITHDHDWSWIEVREYPCLTLQTCHPINVADQRMFVVARLIAVEEVEPG